MASCLATASNRPLICAVILVLVLMWPDLAAADFTQLVAALCSHSMEFDMTYARQHADALPRVWPLRARSRPSGSALAPSRGGLQPPLGHPQHGGGEVLQRRVRQAFSVWGLKSSGWFLRP
ncbi:hypothetical protein CRG98_023916 [Punica granatum]|uniref:Uncharacterized protein n=1 Tax=Punica granatum TaxID=22663 RepID=A0A2I0JIG1_PUNGR|nr:hypothetical protein CRG98_023916 [Punica granatum]